MSEHLRSQAEWIAWAKLAAFRWRKKPPSCSWSVCAPKVSLLLSTPRAQATIFFGFFDANSHIRLAYSIVRRGPIEVKGKGGMVTYFVDKRQPDQQLAPAAATVVAPQHRSSATRSSCDGDDRGADVRRLMSTRSGGSVGQTAGEFFSPAC